MRLRPKRATQKRLNRMAALEVLSQNLNNQSIAFQSGMGPIEYEIGRLKMEIPDYKAFTLSNGLEGQALLCLKLRGLCDREKTP